MFEFVKSIFSAESLKAIGDIVGTGLMGFGAVLAIFATILLLIKNRNSTQFLIFAGSLFFIGFLLEILKTREASIESEREFNASQILPDELWQDFLSSRVSQEFTVPNPVKDDENGWLDQNEKKPFDIYIPKYQCRYYFVATKPPAQIIVDVKSDEGLLKFNRPSREYYKAGKLCLEGDRDAQNVHLEAQMRNSGAQYSIKIIEAPRLPELPEGTTATAATTPTTPPAAAPATVPTTPVTPPAPKPFSKVACIGQYQGACPKDIPYDVWVGCGAPPEDQLAAQLCGSGAKVTTWQKIGQRGGNQCGYALLKANCI